MGTKSLALCIPSLDSLDPVIVEPHLLAIPRKLLRRRTKMVFVGIKNEQEIKDLTAFLKLLDASGKKTL